MDTREPQETGQPADANVPKAGAPGPGDSPTITLRPGASGIAEALGQEIPVFSAPDDFIHELTQSGLMEPAEASAYRQRVSSDARATCATPGPFRENWCVSAA